MTELTPIDFPARVVRLQQALKENRVAAYVATRQATLAYFAGVFAPWRTACIIPAHGDPVLLAWEYDVSRLRSETWIPNVVEYDRDQGFDRALAHQLRSVHRVRGQVAVELGPSGSPQVPPGSLLASEYLALLQRLGDVRFIDGIAIADALMAVKEPAELERLRKACLAADAGFNKAKEHLRAGVSEQEIAGIIECAVRQYGSEWAWATTGGTEVAFGTRTAYRSGVTQPATRLRANAGDMVIVDIHTMYDLYLADLACNLCIGKPTPEQRRLADVWERGVAMLLESIRPGAHAADIARAVWDQADAAGYGEFTLPSFGHGLGTCARVPPFVNPRSRDVFEEGMTLAAGFHLYRPGIGGMRLELPVVVTKDGAEPLSEIPPVLHELV